MKILSLIINADAKQAFADALLGMKHTQIFTFTPIEGHGVREESDAVLTARDLVVGYVPQVRVDIVLEDQDVDSVLADLRGEQHGLAGRGRYWVTPLESQGRL